MGMNSGPSSQIFPSVRLATNLSAQPFQIVGNIRQGSICPCITGCQFPVFFGPPTASSQFLIACPNHAAAMARTFCKVYRIAIYTIAINIYQPMSSMDTITTIRQSAHQKNSAEIVAHPCPHRLQAGMQDGGNTGTLGLGIIICCDQPQRIIKGDQPVCLLADF